MIAQLLQRLRSTILENNYIQLAPAAGGTALFEIFKKHLVLPLRQKVLLPPNCIFFAEIRALCKYWIDRIAAAWFLERSRWSKPYLFKDFSAIINCNVISVGSLWLVGFSFQKMLMISTNFNWNVFNTYLQKPSFVNALYIKMFTVSFIT